MNNISRQITNEIERLSEGIKNEILKSRTQFEELETAVKNQLAGGGEILVENLQKHLNKVEFSLKLMNQRENEMRQVKARLATIENRIRGGGVENDQSYEIGFKRPEPRMKRHFLDAYRLEDELAERRGARPGTYRGTMGFRTDDAGPFVELRDVEVVDNGDLGNDNSNIEYISYPGGSA